MAPLTDWRLQGQEKYLKGVQLILKPYRPHRENSDHDHCEFCTRKFSKQEGDLHEGYVTADRDRWICRDCYADFKDSFAWTVDSQA